MNAHRRTFPFRCLATALLLASFAGLTQLHAQDQPSPISADTILSNPESITGIKLSFDVGQLKTQFGDTASRTKAYQYPQRSSAYINFSGAFDHALKVYPRGIFYAGAKVDFTIPFDMSDSTGNPLDFGIMGGIFGDYRGFSAGTGIEARQFSLPAEGSFARNAQLLYGIPVSAEVNLKRFKLRGSGSYYLANIDGGLLQNLSNDPSTGGVTTISVNNTISNLSTSQTSYDLRGTAGYRLSDSTWITFNYLHRAVFFDLTNEQGSSDPNVMNFTQNQLSGGIYFHPSF
jgi:hypothetical protein